MAAEGDKAPPKRRSTKTKQINSSDPRPLTYPTPENKTTRFLTDSFQADEGLPDRERAHTSVVRYTSSNPTVQRTTQLPPQRTTQLPATPTPIPSRRQKLTRDLPPEITRQLSPARTGRTTRAMQPVTKRSAPTGRFHKLRHMHWLFLVGLGMMVALALWFIGSAAVSWGIQRYYDFTYGNPRTFQSDSVVGHGGDSNAHPSHFIAVNLNHLAIVMELRAGDPGKSISYSTPVYNDDNSAPVTLEFRDVTNDKKPDMIVHIHLSNQEEQVAVFVNTGDQFRPSNSNDRLKL